MYQNNLTSQKTAWKCRYHNAENLESQTYFKQKSTDSIPGQSFMVFYQNLCCYNLIPSSISHYPVTYMAIFLTKKLSAVLCVNVTLIICFVFLSTNAAKFKYSKLHL